MEDSQNVTWQTAGDRAVSWGDSARDGSAAWAAAGTVSVDSLLATATGERLRDASGIGILIGLGFSRAEADDSGTWIPEP